MDGLFQTRLVLSSSSSAFYIAIAAASVTLAGLAAPGHLVCPVCNEDGVAAFLEKSKKNGTFGLRPMEKRVEGARGLYQEF